MKENGLARQWLEGLAEGLAGRSGWKALETIKTVLLKRSKLANRLDRLQMEMIQKEMV